MVCQYYHSFFFWSETLIDYSAWRDYHSFRSQTLGWLSLCAEWSIRVSDQKNKMSESFFFFFDSGTIYNGSHRYYMDTLFSPKVKYRISTVNHSKKFTDPVPDPDPDSDSGENCLSVCRSDYYIVTCSMRSAVGIKKSYIELFTDSRLFWGGKTRIRNCFLKKFSPLRLIWVEVQH